MINNKYDRCIKEKNNKIRKVNAFFSLDKKSKLLGLNSILFNSYSKFSEKIIEIEK